MTISFKQGPWPRVYFDCNSTTPLIEEAAESASLALHERYANPSSLHWEGCRAKALREDARGAAAKLFDAYADEIVFTSGATESIHTAIFGALLTEAKRLRNGGKKGKSSVIYGATEHKVVPEAIRHWVSALDLPLSIEALPVDRNGHFDLSWLRERIGTCYLLCTMAVNNETGLIQDLDSVADILDSVSDRPLWLVDGVQALGKVDLKWSTRKIDFLAFSGHKVHAPKGSGLLLARRGSACAPLLVGGGQEAGRRSGTEPLPALAGFGTVLHLMASEKENGRGGSIRSAEDLKMFQKRLIHALENSFPEFHLNAPAEEVVPTTIHFSVRGYSSAQIWMLLEAHGVFVSSGSACQSAKQGFSHVLTAMGLEEWRLASAARLSFGLAANTEEIDAGINAIQRAGQSVRDASGSVSCISRFHNGVTCAYLFVDLSSRVAAVWGDVHVLGSRIVSCLKELSARHGSIQLMGCWGLREREGQTVFALEALTGFGDEARLKASLSGQYLPLNGSVFQVRSFASESFETLPLVIFSSRDAVNPEHLARLSSSETHLGLVCEDSSPYSGVPFLIRNGQPIFINLDHVDRGSVLDWEQYQTIRSSETIRLIDVRERFEQVPSSPFHHVRELFGDGLETWPFSEIVQLLRDALKKDPHFETKWLFICRSGTRSRYAAELFRQLGWHGAQSLKEGFLGLASKV